MNESHSAQVITDALIALITELTARVAELEAELDRRKSRAWELRVALNNSLSATPEKVQEIYRPVLDREDDQ